jgi:hypothetical protein
LYGKKLVEIQRRRDRKTFCHGVEIRLTDVAYSPKAPQFMEIAHKVASPIAAANNTNNWMIARMHAILLWGDLCLLLVMLIVVLD